MATSTSKGHVEYVLADMKNPAHATAVVSLLDEYAKDPMGGGGAGLPEDFKLKLPLEISRRPTVRCLLALDEDAAPAGVAVVIESFSTFACASILNLHDMYVSPRHRRRGIATALLGKVEALARDLDCRKLTLEVLENNAPAQRAYRAAGFQAYELDPAMGRALFWEKKLTPQ